MYYFFKCTKNIPTESNLKVTKVRPFIRKDNKWKENFHILLWRLFSLVNNGEYWLYELWKDNRMVSRAEVCTPNWQFPFIGREREREREDSRLPHWTMYDNSGSTRQWVLSYVTE